MMKTTHVFAKTCRNVGGPAPTGKRRLLLTLASLTLSATLLSSVASAQPAGGAGGGQPSQPGQGRPNRGGFGGQGGFAARMPFTSGTVTGGDANARTIIITPQGGNAPGGNPQGGNAQGANGFVTIKVTQNTQFVVQSTVTVADLKFGDRVQVQGVPSGITASAISAGDPPDLFNFGRGRNVRGNGGAAGAAAPNAQGNNANNADPNAPQMPPPANASATGKVVSTNPLTIEVNKDISIVLKLAPNGKVTKYMPTTYDKLKVGDKIIAAGQMGDDGIFAATSVGVNMDMGAGRMGFGPGGFGAFGGFPGGGFGGPGFGPGGGFGPGAGGFPGGGGGGRNGRRNRQGDPNNPPPGNPNNP